VTDACDENPNMRIIAGDSFAAAQHDARLGEYRRKWRDNPPSRTVERFPIHLDIESTSICNLKCPFCAGTNETYSYGIMNFELFRKIVDEGAEKGLYSIKLNFRGEPLIHPGIAGMIAYAKEKGIVDVFFNTNATLLNEASGKALIEASLDRLIVSFEGYSKVVYERNRVGACFEDVVDNIRKFVVQKKTLGASRPVLRLQTVNISGDSGYLNRYREFWGEYPDEITCIDLRDEEGDYSCLEPGGWQCPYPWLRLCITWDGTALTCPFMNRGEGAYTWKGFGNIRETSIEEIWHSPDMERIRASQTAGTSHHLEPCRFCSYRGTEILKQERGKV